MKNPKHYSYIDFLKDRKTQSSFGWLVAWVFLFWPVAIYYWYITDELYKKHLRKMKKKWKSHKKTIATSKGQLSFGG